MYINKRKFNFYFIRDDKKIYPIRIAIKFTSEIENEFQFQLAFTSQLSLCNSNPNSIFNSFINSMILLLIYDFRIPRS